MPDIDIDFADRTVALEKFKHVPASRLENNTFKKHNTGVYCTAIPYDSVTGLASLDYETAEQRGYFKIDFLNVSVYKDITDEKELSELLEIEPLWDLLEQKDFCDLVFHVNSYHNLIAALKPRSIEQIAMFLALIRPGKKHLVSKVQTQGWDSVKDEIWLKTDDTYSFKKSHAIAYAHAIAVQMNKICKSISWEFS
jgi:DNA polymerase III alpha subunit